MQKGCGRTPRRRGRIRKNVKVEPDEPVSYEVNCGLYFVLPKIWSVVFTVCLGLFFLNIDWMLTTDKNYFIACKYSIKRCMIICLICLTCFSIDSFFSFSQDLQDKVKELEECNQQLIRLLATRSGTPALPLPSPSQACKPCRRGTSVTDRW